MTFTTWKVRPSESGWIVYCKDEDSYESRHRDKGAATWEAEQLAQEDPPSQVVIHAADGSVKRAVHYSDAGKDPMASGTITPSSESLEAA